METTDRLDVINRAMQHDLVLLGTAAAGQPSTYRWRGVGGPISPRFDDRAAAINWMIDWLAYDTPDGDD